MIKLSQNSGVVLGHIARLEALDVAPVAELRDRLPFQFIADRLAEEPAARGQILEVILSEIHEHEFSAVVGVGRAGLVFAALVADQCNLPIAWSTRDWRFGSASGALVLAPELRTGAGVDGVCRDLARQGAQVEQAVVFFSQVHRGAEPIFDLRDMTIMADLQGYAELHGSTLQEGRRATIEAWKRRGIQVGV